MRRPHSFVFRRVMLSPGVLAQRTGAPLPPRGFGVMQSPGDPLLELLAQLTGREVVLQVGSLRQKGRVVEVDRLLMLESGGRVCHIRPEAIISVDF